MDTKSKPIYGCLQYPHVDFETGHNPEMEFNQQVYLDPAGRGVVQNLD
jgi:hypothetical protein